MASGVPVTDLATTGGGRGIRTPGDITATVVFKTTALSRSAIPPVSLVYTVERPLTTYPLSIQASRPVVKKAYRLKSDE